MDASCYIDFIQLQIPADAGLKHIFVAGCCLSATVSDRSSFSQQTTCSWTYQTNCKNIQQIQATKLSNSEWTNKLKFKVERVKDRETIPEPVSM